MSSEYTYATATELTAAMNAGMVSSVELTESAIARIEDHDDKINAVVVHDFDRALDAARLADATRARGGRGRLLGVPMTVKESFNVAGIPTTWGIPPLKDFVPTEDALAVARMKSEGGVILGKTNVPVALGDLQSYNPIYGTTRNPWDLNRTPGGSSGGSAAALAAGFGAISLGSDIAGSLRVPAHFTGTYAHKSSFGLLPSRGHTPPFSAPLEYSRDLTVIGPMARSAVDLALMLDLLAEPDETGLGIARTLSLRPPRHEHLSEYRVLIVDTHPLIPTSSDIRMALESLADDLGSAGVRVQRHSDLLPDPTEAARIYMRLLLASVASTYPSHVYEQAAARAVTLDPDDTSLAAERSRGASSSYRDWLADDALRSQHRAAWSRLFTEFDIVICPASPTTAFAHDHSADQWTRSITIDGAEHDYADQLVWAGIATVPGLPATVAPIAQSSERLPIGAQLIGPLFEDRTPIHFAQLIEREFGGFTPARPL